MKRALVSLTAALALCASVTPAMAADINVFNGLLFRNSLLLEDLTLNKKFKPKAACSCNTASAGAKAPGIVVLDGSNGSLRCLLPFFDANGRFEHADDCNADWVPLPK